jgi:NAD(P)H-nitrite reductase large subunit
LQVRVNLFQHVAALGNGLVFVRGVLFIQDRHFGINDVLVHAVGEYVLERGQVCGAVVPHNVQVVAFQGLVHGFAEYQGNAGALSG